MLYSDSGDEVSDHDTDSVIVHVECEEEIKAKWLPILLL